MSAVNVKHKHRLIIVDPSLKDLRGHHFNLTRNATLSAVNAGFEVLWYCSSELRHENGLSACDADVRPIFEVSMYDRYKQSANNKTKSKETSLQKSLISAMKKEFALDKVNHEDRIFFHTADGATYLAIAEFIEGAREKTCPIFHVCTPYDPVGVMPNRDDADEIRDAITSLKDRGFVERKIFYYGENPFLAEHLSSIWDIPVHTLELPVTQSHNQYSITSLVQFRRERFGLSPFDFLTIYLGSARLEKGYQLLPYVVNRVFEFAGKGEFDNIKPETLHFIFQSSPQIIGYHKDIKTALKKMESMPTSKVTCLKHTLSEDEYYMILYACDAIILPYESDKYKVRGSGIVSEAITAGKIILATESSYPAKRISEGAGGTANTPLEFARVLLRIAQNRTSYKHKAIAASEQYCKDNALESYWPGCLQVEIDAAAMDVTASR